MRKAVSWLFFALGVSAGYCGLVMFCQSWIPEAHVDPNSFALWFETAGWGILGAVFFLASFVALWNRRVAGFLLLVSAPLVAFCLCFQDTRLGVPFRGFHYLQPGFSIALLFVCAFYVPLYVPLGLARVRTRSAVSFLLLALLSGTLFRLHPWSVVIVPRLVASSVPLLVLGAFWLGAGMRNWPPLAGTRPWSISKRLGAVSVGSALITVPVLLGSMAVSAYDSEPWDRDCGGRALLVRPLDSDHVVFTARAIRVAHVAKIEGRWAGNWAIGLVQEHFWGLPGWSPRLVLLTTHAFWEGETYLIDGRREQRLLSRLLPIVQAGPCAYTLPIADAGVQLRLLRETPSSGGLRIVGHIEDHLNEKEMLPAKSPRLPDWNATSNAEIEGWHQRFLYSTVSYRRIGMPLRNARIRVTGSSGSLIVTADRDGNYEAAGLLPDDYKLELLDVPDTQAAANSDVSKKELTQNKIVRADLALLWNGTIEGRIRDSSGGPARLSLRPERANGTTTFEPLYNVQTDAQGNFKCLHLPPGRYILRLNEFGPRHGAPYFAQYFPASATPAGARVFEVAGGQHIRNVEIVLRRLDERNLQARVTWPDGRPADDAIVQIAYQGNGLYGRDGGPGADADRNGFASVTTFSGSRIRVWAEHIIDGGQRGPSLRYSHAVELDTDHLPTHVDLVLNATRHPLR